MVDSRHVDQETARQGDVRSDARALLSERFLGYLDDEFLAFAQQVANGWRGGLFRAHGFRTGELTSIVTGFRVSGARRKGLPGLLGVSPGGPAAPAHTTGKAM